MAHKKGEGSTSNGRDSNSKRLGVKLFGSQKALAGNIIVRQRGTKFHLGENVYFGNDFTIHAAVPGTVTYRRGRRDRVFVSILPFVEVAETIAKIDKPVAKPKPRSASPVAVAVPVVPVAAPVEKIVAAPVVEAVKEIIVEAAAPVVVEEVEEAIVEAAAPVVEEVEEAIVEAAAPVVEEVEEAIVEAAAPVVEEVVEVASPVVEEVEEIIVEAAAPDLEEVVEVAAPVVEEVEEIIVEAAAPVMEVVEEVVEVAAPVVVVGSNQDDLKKIEGIGPKIEELLNEDGIFTFAELASSSYERIKGILDDAGPRYKIHDPNTWMRQAALAAAGNWAELKTLQDALDGGKE